MYAMFGVVTAEQVSVVRSCQGQSRSQMMVGLGNFIYMLVQKSLSVNMLKTHT